jgi:hypothetical protein
MWQLRHTTKTFPVTTPKYYNSSSVQGFAAKRDFLQDSRSTRNLNPTPTGICKIKTGRFSNREIVEVDEAKVKRSMYYKGIEADNLK